MDKNDNLFALHSIYFGKTLLENFIDSGKFFMAKEVANIALSKYFSNGLKLGFKNNLLSNIRKCYDELDYFFCKIYTKNLFSHLTDRKDAYKVLDFLRQIQFTQEETDLERHYYET